MSFNLYKKYKLEELSELCCQKVCMPENNGNSLPDALSLLHPITIVVQTRGTAEYLRQQIAGYCGVMEKREALRVLASVRRCIIREPTIRQHGNLDMDYSSLGVVLPCARKEKTKL